MKKIFRVIILAFVLCLTGCGAKEATNTEDTQRKEATRLIVYAPLSNSGVMDKGWIADIFSDELDLVIEVVSGYEAEQKADSIDVIINVSGEYCVEEYVNNGEVMEWTDELLLEYGQNITKYREEQLDYFTELCGGKVYGFCRSDMGKGEATCMITSHTEHPEEAMKFLNWLAEPENMVTVINGPKGVCWDIDEEGYYYLTDLGMKCKENPGTEIPGTGGLDFDEGAYTIAPLIYHWTDVNPISKHGETFDGRDWISSQD